jgi:hypothetical protein
MIYGWDVSTSIVGMAEFDDNGKFVRVEHLDLRKLDDFTAKADAAERWIRSFDVIADESGTHYIEERLGNFSSGRSMIQVMMKLAAYNAVFAHLLHQTAPYSEIRYLHPSSWKAIMKRDGLLIPKGTDKKKEITLAFVRSKVPQFQVPLNRNDKPQPWCYDMADAYCIGRAGYLKYAQGKKAGSVEEESP